MGPEHFIAIVDDDVAVREAVKGLLEAQGFKVAAFSSATAFLVYAGKDSISCALVDIRMPGMDGPRLQVRLARDGCSVPLIFMSAYVDEIVRARVLAAGAVAFLTKPFTEEMLLTAIAAARQPLASRVRVGAR